MKFNHLCAVLIALIIVSFLYKSREQFYDFGLDSPYINRLPDYRETTSVTSLDHIYNPYRTRTNVQEPNYNYPNLILPAPVIGCGARRQGCLGGSQFPIPNVPPPFDISNTNIAPVTVATRADLSPEGVPHQVGVIYKLFGNENRVYPLYGAKRYYNGDKWDYYTILGPSQVKVPVLTKNNNYRLGSNDRVWIEGRGDDEFRVTIYDQIQYYPYL